MSDPPKTTDPPEPHEPPESGLTHLASGPAGLESRMVDVGAKPVTARAAVARARVVFPEGLLGRLLREGGPKGPILEVARSAGALAAKRTGELIPLCHPLGLDVVAFEFREEDPGTLEIRCRAACHGRTGVEMEALTGAAVAALTVYDMTKGVDRSIRIEAVELLAKSGGKSGDWERSPEPR